MKLKSVILIITGVLIACYPMMKHAYTVYQQERLLKEWDGELKNQEQSANSASDDVSEDAAQSFLVLEDAFSEENEKGSEENESEHKNESIKAAEEQSIKETPKTNEKPDVNVLGVLYIEKINAKLPILDGSTPQILKKGAGKLKGTSDIGEIGNTAISAHRSHKYGLQFNRLNEVEIGDKVTVTTLDNKFNYEVFNIQVVEPDDVSLLKKSKTESILTLITCHPLYIANQRLIVQARLLPDQ